MNNLSFSNLLRRPEAGAFLGLVGVLVFFVVFGSTKFLEPAGAASWLNVAANLGIIALPIGLLMIAGDLDISIGATISTWNGQDTPTGISASASFRFPIYSTAQSPKPGF